jgi:hypothetical protein
VPGVICAAACLPAGFAVAVATDVRPLGGLVLAALAAVAVCGLPRERRWQCAAIVFACFVASHLLVQVIGAWGAVAVVTVIVTAVYATAGARQPL